LHATRINPQRIMNKQSNRRKLTRLGESTNNMLNFQDMMNSHQAQIGRLHRSMDPSVVLNRRKKSPTPTAHGSADICRRPLKRGVRKSFSSPPVVLPREDEIEWQRNMVSVIPGYSIPLCGAAETMDAVKKNRIIHTECTSCSSFLYCIDIASMVLCSSCRYISPVESSSSNHNVHECLGLGLTADHATEEFGR
jgi:hypothetical protein